MSGDVGEVENSITSSLDMLMKSPIMIILYFATLVITSWQLTLFTIVVLPGMGWLMGVVGRKLKRQSLEAQASGAIRCRNWKKRWVACALSKLLLRKTK